MLTRYNGKKYEIAGDKCILGTIKESDLPKFVKWMKDKKVTRHLSQDNPDLTLAKEKKWYANAKKAKNEVHFGIYALDDAKEVLIGTCSLLKIDLNNYNAEFGIAIGDRNYWGKGIGTEATNLMIDFAFRIVKLNSFYLVVNDGNIAGQKAYKRAGFKKVGLLRDHHCHNKKPEDSFMMDITRKDWKC